MNMPMAVPTLPKNQRPWRPDPLASPVVVIDTREQKPYRFPHSVVKTLPTGDYSLVGMEHRVAIERKTHQDAYSSLGLVRPRFQREMERMSELEYGALVIETSLREFLKVPGYGLVAPGSAINALLAYSARFGVHLFFAEDRRHGNAVTCQLLSHFWRYRRQA